MYMNEIYRLYLDARQWLRNTDHLQEAVRKRRKERNESIAVTLAEAEKLDEIRRAEILSYDFSSLREKLQNDDLTPTEVLQAYQYAAVIAHDKTNCVTMFLEEATEIAAKLEEKAKEPGYKKPPFFGIPISIKESLDTAGHDSTWGFLQMIDNPKTEDIIPIARIRDLGFVPFVHTNLPQSGKSFHCSNPIYGDTTHPDDPKRTPGGSSGGESAIIGAGGSIFGLGGDLGGSIRMPAAFVGLVGMKPCARRCAQAKPSGNGATKLVATDGPLAKKVDDVVQFYREYWKSSYIHSRDPYFAPLEFNEDYYREDRKYTIGYYVDDGFLTPVPAYKRAVVEAKKLLEARGHKVVPFSPPNIREAMKHFFITCFSDGGHKLCVDLDKDIPEPNMSKTYDMFYIPQWLQRVTAYFYQDKEPKYANSLGVLTNNVYELRMAYKFTDDYRYQFYAQMQKQGIDAILCPPMIMTAPLLDVPPQILWGVTYTALYNFLDYPAGVVNVTKVTAEDERAAEDYVVADRFDQLIKDSAKDSVGLPVNVQIAAPPFREEIVLRLMRDIELAQDNQRKKNA